MAAYLQLDDVNSLKAKIDDKAHDLFRAKSGVAPLQVSRYFKTKVGKGKEANCFLKNQDVWDNKEVKSLRHVCANGSLLPIQTSIEAPPWNFQMRDEI